MKARQQTHVTFLSSPKVERYRTESSAGPFRVAPGQCETSVVAANFSGTLQWQLQVGTMW